MMNMYIIVLALFTVASFGVALWGWKIMSKNKEQKKWPTVEGEIIESESATNMADIFPRIVFRYEVDGRTRERELEFPGGTQPTPELSTAYVKKYPVGAKVTIYYNPADPQDATPEPGVASDWMIFALGLLATVLGTAFILSGI